LRSPHGSSSIALLRDRLEVELGIVQLMKVAQASRRRGVHIVVDKKDQPRAVLA